MAKSNGLSKFFITNKDLVLSDAYIELSAPAIHLLNNLHLKCRWKKPKDRKASRGLPIRTDDNRFTLTYKEAEQTYGFKSGVTARAFDKLLKVGFIKVVHPGGACNKDKATYALVDDWKKWRKGDPAVRERSKDCKRGYQGKPVGAVKDSDAVKTN